MQPAGTTERFPWKCLVQTGPDDKKTIGGVDLGRVSWHHRDCPVFGGTYCDCYESTRLEILREQNQRTKRVV